MAKKSKKSAAQNGPRAVVAHDSGDGGLLNHCPFCGSGAVTGRSDGSVECDYCHTVFTVQVQPSNPNMPQTIDGQPVTPPGMPGGDPTEMSAPEDPAVKESEDGVAQQGLGDAADPTKKDPTQDAAPAPDSGQGGKGGGGTKPNPFAKKDDAAGAPKSPAPGAKKPNPFAKKTSLTYRTAAGEALSEEDYIKHLALTFADDRTEVLSTLQAQALLKEADVMATCPACHGSGGLNDSEDCTVCDGTGLVTWAQVEEYRNHLEHHDQDTSDIDQRYPHDPTYASRRTHPNHLRSI